MQLYVKNGKHHFHAPNGYRFDEKFLKDIAFVVGTEVSLIHGNRVVCWNDNLDMIPSTAWEQFFNAQLRPFMVKGML